MDQGTNLSEFQPSMLCSYDSLSRYFLWQRILPRLFSLEHYDLPGLYVSCTRTRAVIVLPLESRIFSGAPVGIDQLDADLAWLSGTRRI